MNPEAVKLAYELFQKDGYTGSQQQFVSLINENSKALDLAHSLFSQEGYTDGLDRFSGLMGVGKKKGEALLSTTQEGDVVSSSEEGEGIASSDGVIPIDDMLAGLPPEDYETVSEVLEREAAEREIPKEEQLRREEEKKKQETLKDIKRQVAEKGPTVDYKPEIKETAELEGRPMMEGIEEEGMRAVAEPILQERKSKEFEQEFQKQADLMIEQEALKRDEQYISDINADMNQYMGQRPENALKDLKSKYSKYGFIFEEGASEDYVKATAKNGQTLQIPLNPLYVNAETMPQDLKAFIDTNARKPKTDLTVIEKMGMDFFANEDMDYATYQDMQERYDSNKELLLKGLPLQKPDGLDPKFEYMYTDNVLRADANEIYEKLEKENKQIREFLFTKEYEEIRTQWNLKLDREYQVRSRKFVDFNAKLNDAVRFLDEESMKLLGVGLNDIANFETDDPVLQERRDVIIQGLSTLLYQQKEMSKLYDIQALPFYEAKWDKQTRGELVYGMEAFRNATNKGYDTGEGLAAIMMAATGMVDISEGTKSLEDLSLEISKHFADANTGKFSVGDVTNRRAQGTWEYFRSLRNNPVPFIGALVGNSLAQLLPISSELAPYIIGPSMVKGFVKDASKASVTGNPLVVGLAGLKGTVKGGFSGVNTLFNATTFAVEYSSSVMGAMERLHGDLSNPENVEKALLDPQVWEEGGNEGVRRGLPILLVEYFGNKYAGKMFKQAKYGTKARRISANLAERMLIDPLLEGTGEALAQVVSGQEFDLKEVSNEMLAGFGSNTPNMVVNRVLDLTNMKESKLLKDLTDLNFLLNESASGNKISNFVNEQEKKGRVTKEDAEIIRNNISARTQAREILNVDEYNKDKPTKEPKVEARLAELIAAEKKLEATDASKIAYSEVLREITKEIKEISTTRELRDSDQQTDLSILKKEVAPTEAAPTEDKPIEADEENIGEVNPTQTYSFRFEKGNVPPAFQRLTPTGMIEAAKGLLKRKKSVTLMFKGQQLIDAGLATQAAPTEAAPTEAAPTEVAPTEAAPTQKRKLNTKGFIELGRNFFRSEGKTETPRDKDNIKRVADVQDRASKAITAIANILPNTNIVLHDTQDSYKAATGKTGRGGFDSSTNTIHINLDKAIDTTVAHEVFHAVLFNKLGAGVELQGSLKQMVTSVAKVVNKRSELGIYLDKFMKGYESQVEGMSQESAEAYLNEERLSELVGVLSANYDQLEKPQKNAIVNFIEKVAAKFGIDLGTDFGKTDESVIDFLNVLSDRVTYGEEISDSDMQIFFTEQGTGGLVGTFNLPIKEQIEVTKAPSVKDDPRDYIRDHVEDIDMREFQGQKFVSNMYDFTTAGEKDLGNGLVANFFGGVNYVPYMMSLRGLKIGDETNLAAFQGKSNAEAFIRNVQSSGASLFAPSSGSLKGSWQFQQHIFDTLTDLALDNKLITDEKLIDYWTKVYNRSKDGRKEFATFQKNYEKKFNPKGEKEVIQNLNRFKDNAKEFVSLLGVGDNMSSDLRKRLNDSLTSLEAFQKAIGVTSKPSFYSRLQDPLNIGSNLYDIMGVVKFDPSTLTIRKTTPNDIDHHPSFSWTVEAKIEGIYHPTEFYKSYDITDSYTKYNKDGVAVSRKADIGLKQFIKQNVGGQTGGILKVTAPIKIPKDVKVKSDIKEQIDSELSKASGGTQVTNTESSYGKVADMLKLRGITGNVLDFGAGLGLGTDAMSDVLGGTVDSFEINTEGWRGKKPPTYTSLSEIDPDKKYDAIVSLNVLNVVPKDIRDGIVKEIYDRLEDGGVAYISARGFSGDVNQGTPIAPSVEPKSIFVRKNGKKTFQKGFDRNELTEYVQDILGDKVTIVNSNASIKAKNPKLDRIKFGNRSIIVTKESSGIREQIDVESRAEEFGKFKDKYKEAMARIDKAIAKMKAEGKTKQDIIKRVLSSLKRTKIYNELDDLLREELIRDAKKKVGVRIKSAPSVAKLFGKINDVKKITLTEKQLLLNRITALSQGARGAVKELNNIRKRIADSVKDLEGKGKISARQVTSVIGRLSKLNLENEAKVGEFIEYMANIFTKSEYLAILAKANKLIPKAKINIRRGKLGILDGGLFEDLIKLLTIKSRLIPTKVLDSYMSLLDQLSKGAILEAEARTKISFRVTEILDAIKKEQDLIPELTFRFMTSKNLLIKDGKIDFAASVNEMLRKEEITKEEAEIMRKYKNLIMPPEGKEEMSEEDIQKQKQKYTDSAISTRTKLLNGKIDLPTRLERDAARKLLKLFTKGRLMNMELNELKNIVKLLNNIENGYFPHYAQLLLEQFEAMEDVDAPYRVVLASKMLPISKFFAKIEQFATSIFNKGGSYVDKMIKNNPNFYIDQLFGDFKTKRLFDSLFKKIAEGVSNVKTELSTIGEQIQKAQANVEASFGRNPNKIMMSKFKQMAYLLQLEYNDNPEHRESKQVNQASEVLKATIAAIKQKNTVYGSTDKEVNRAVKMLEEILEKFSDDTEEIDVAKLMRSFNKAERASIKAIAKINKGLTGMALFASSVLRGKRVPTFASYVHHRVLAGRGMKTYNDETQALRGYSKSIQPSTKAKNLIEREGTVEPLLLDPYTTTYRGAKMTLMDFHLTSPIRVARRTMAALSKKLEGIDMNGTQIDVFNALDEAVEKTIEQVISNTANITSQADNVLNAIGRSGYRAMLARSGKLVIESFSNFLNGMLIDPVAYAIGLGSWSTEQMVLLPQVMRNLNSTQTSTMFSGNTLSGRMIDISINADKAQRGKVTPYSQVGNAVAQIYNQTAKRAQNVTEKTADLMISTPDKIATIPMWQGSFIKKFYDLTKTQPDFEKIAANDEAYMNKYEQQLKEATALADSNSAFVGASGNVALNAMKLNKNIGENTASNMYKLYNNFLSRFLIWEWTAARTGVGLLIQGDKIEKRRGVAILAATVLRMTTYNLLMKRYGNIIAELLFGEDDEDKKSFSKALGQAFVQTSNDMIFGRNFGNVARSLMNIGIERFNQNTLDFLRDGEYDAYEDSVAYSIFLQDPNDYRKQDIGDFIVKMSGPYSPLVKTLDLGIRVLTDKPKKDPAAIERQRKEKLIRLPVEIMGQLGVLPFYADIRKMVIEDVYKDMGKSTPSFNKQMKALEKVNPEMAKKFKKQRKEIEDRLNKFKKK